jgi:hypothetical protein
MHKRETVAGMTICRAPSMIAVSMSLPSSKWVIDVLDRYGRVVDQHANRERETA